MNRNKEEEGEGAAFSECVRSVFIPFNVMMIIAESR